MVHKINYEHLVRTMLGLRASSSDQNPDSHIDTVGIDAFDERGFPFELKNIEYSTKKNGGRYYHLGAGSANTVAKQIWETFIFTVSRDQDILEMYVLFPQQMRNFWDGVIYELQFRYEHHFIYKKAREKAARRDLVVEKRILADMQRRLNLSIPMTYIRQHGFKLTENPQEELRRLSEVFHRSPVKHVLRANSCRHEFDVYDENGVLISCKEIVLGLWNRGGKEKNKRSLEVFSETGMGSSDPIPPVVTLKIPTSL